MSRGREGFSVEVVLRIDLRFKRPAPAVSMRLLEGRVEWCFVVWSVMWGGVWMEVWIRCPVCPGLYSWYTGGIRTPPAPFFVTSRYEKFYTVAKALLGFDWDVETIGVEELADEFLLLSV